MKVIHFEHGYFLSRCCVVSSYVFWINSLSVLLFGNIPFCRLSLTHFFYLSIADIFLVGCSFLIYHLSISDFVSGSFRIILKEY